MLGVAVAKQRGSFALDARFELPTPGVVALFGRSGSGKSTLVNVIAGLLGADSGQVTLDGTPLLDTQRHIDVPPERRRIGYVFQDARLFPHLRVAANLKYGQRRAAGPAYVNFDMVVDLLELDRLLHRRVHELSGGERQRVAIGRALLSQPRLLLLDEPLASLDAARRDEVLPYLEALRDRLSIPMVFVSHQFDEVLRLATHLVLLEGGRVLAHGNLQAMCLRPELQSIVGPELVGAVLEGTVSWVDARSGSAMVAVGSGTLQVALRDVAVGTPVRLQLLARDIILATEVVQHLSVRNVLAGRIAELTDDPSGAVLVRCDVGGVMVLARITRDARGALDLRPGMSVWVLVKAVSLGARAYRLSARRTAAEHAGLG
jgi:molybdate transport system ATP-binding protein